MKPAVPVLREEAIFVAPSEPRGADAPAAYFRREFAVGPGVVSATLRLTGLGIVEPWINGERVGDEVLAPGWTSYRHRLAVSEHDITGLLAEGANAFGAIIGEGWAQGRLGWEGRRHFWSDRPVLIAELELRYEDRVEYICTDEAVRIGEGSVRSNSIYDGETADARLEPPGWSRAGFDDAEWEAATEYSWPRSSLITPTAPPIRRVEEIRPRLDLRSDGRVIVDVGQNISGWLRLTLRGKAGTEVLVRHAEALTPDGELEFETIRTAAATDTWVLAGFGDEVFEPRFTFHGFRYAEITGAPDALSVDDVRAIVVHSDMTRTGWLTTSDPLLNRLHENVVWSMRDNFVGVPTDCPQRDERLGWTGDINAFAPTAAFLYDVRGVLGSWLDDLAAEQAEKGFVPWVVPDVLSTPSTPTALWSDVAVSLPWALYQQYGDERVLRRAYASMSAFIDQVERLLDSESLWSSGYQFGDWLDPDAPDENPAGGKTDRHLVAQAYLAKTTRELAEAAAILGETDDSARYSTLADRVREAFRREYVTQAGRVTNESATAYALAICFDLLDESQRARAGARLAELVGGVGYTISTGFAGTPLVTEALSSTGHLTEAYLLLMQTRCPSFLYPVTQGATTIWERWDSIRPDGTVNPSGMTSLNHYALGAVADWMHRTIGGLSRLEPGYRRAWVAPQPGGGLTSASLRLDTEHGSWHVSWQIDSAAITMEVTVPADCEALVTVPFSPANEPHLVGPGDHHFVAELPDGYGQKVAFTMDTPLAVLVEEPQVWQQVTEVFARHFPGVPIDGRAPEAAAMSLNIVMGFIPGSPPSLASELEAALSVDEARS